MVYFKMVVTKLARAVLNYNKPSIKAIVINPTKRVEQVKVYPEDKRFVHEKNTYIVDERALYFFNKEPVMFYIVGNASPLIFSEERGVLNGLDSRELTSIIETRAVHDLLTATTNDDKGMMFYMVAATLAGVVLIFLSLTGVVTLG